MPKLKTYNIFISHSWKYSNDYERLVALLNNAPYFSWRNYSVPATKPALAPDEEGSVCGLSKELQTIVAEMVRWNTDSIVSAIRKHSL